MECNQQKMREAFNEILVKIDAWRTDGTMEHWQYSQLFDIADAAISEPPRQCDVGTAEEQKKRFRLFCESHKPAESEFTEKGELLCPASGCELGVCNYGQCALKWAQMPYEAQEGAGE